jgi:hypothetical protein
MDARVITAFTRVFDALLRMTVEELVARIERSEIRDARNDKPGCPHRASFRAFTPVFDRLWTRVNALMAPSGLHAGD